MAIVNTEWLNANESRNYPIHDDATRLDVDGKLLPNDVLADASIWIPSSAGKVVYLSSVGITASLFTLTLLASDEPLCEPSSSSLAAGVFTPLAVVSITKPVTRFKNYAIQALLPGVGGWIVPGAAAAELSDLSLRFDGPDATQLLDRVVRSYDLLPVGSIGKEGNSLALTGLVRLAGTPGSIKTSKAVRTIDGISRTVVAIGMDLGDESVTQLQDMAGPCSGRPQVDTCRKAPIESIHGVTPDESGNITLEFTGEEVIGDVRKGLIIDYPLGVSDVQPVIGSSESGPPVISSESGPGGSEPGPVEPEGSSISSDEYCEDFEDGIADELVVRTGSFEIQEPPGRTKRYISTAGSLVGQIAINPNRDFASIDNYIIKSTIRPLTTGTGSGYLVFGYKDINDFFFVGFTLRGENPSFPDGRFYFGHKVTTVVNWPDGLGDGHVFDISYAPPAPLVTNDYRVLVQLENLAPGVNVAKLEATWNDGTPRSLSQTFVLPGTFNEVGIAGVGAVASETEFDDVGMNCDGSSSSL